MTAWLDRIRNGFCAMCDPSAVAQRARSNEVRIAHATPYWRGLAFLATATFAALVLGYHHDRNWLPPDEGSYAHVADRILALGIQTKDELHDVLATLDREPPKLVFHHVERNSRYGTPVSSEVLKFVKDRYQLLETSGGFEVYRLL